MTDPTNPIADPAWVRGMLAPRMSRRGMLKAGAAGLGALSLPQLLAACGGDGGGDTSEPSGQTVDFTAEPGPNINFSNWPLYIDKAKDPDTGDRYSPSLRRFEEETGITVTYSDEINENAAFFGEIAPQLQAGQDIGRDIIVISTGKEFTALTLNGWVTELDPTLRPNFDANAADWAKSPNHDEGNRFSMAWQSGLTGIGYDTEKVNGEIKTMDDLLDPSLVGNASVGIIKADAPDLVMLNLGIDPKTSTPEDWQAAADWLVTMRDGPTFRTAYDQGYVDDFTAGNLGATIAWSGDVLYYAIYEDFPFEFVVPEGGALLWMDNMLIPANSANPQGAYKLMDYYYQPEVAQMVTEWVLYMSPIPEVQGLIAAHGEEEDDDSLRETAENPLLWPDEALLANTSTIRILTTEEEVSQWSDTFDTIWE